MGEVQALEVLKPGVLTSIQDLGRYGFSQFGVPPSGAVDSFSLRVANLLVGNEKGEACLETAIMGLELKALREIVIAITGGDLLPTLNGEPIEMWRTHLLVEGDLLSFEAVRRGCRAYVAVRGGIVVPEVMRSKSTCLSGRFGGMEGRPLRRGDILRIRKEALFPGHLGRRFPEEWVPAFEREECLRVILGPQDDHFTVRGLQTFLRSWYRVTPQSDRRGVRLEGQEIERRSDREESIISEGLLSGTIQVPGDNKPIILLTELVTGGYAKIATVISTDLPKVAQLKPGDRVRFETIPLKEAHKCLEEQEARLRTFKSAWAQR